MTSALDNVRLLGFDVFGTVVDWRAGVARASEPHLKSLGVAIEPKAFADRWRARYEPSMERVRSGERAWVKLRQLNFENLVSLLAELEIDVPSIPMETLHEWNGAWERLDPWPDSVEGLVRLRSKFKIAPISNGHVDGMKNLARFAGLPWDMILGAEVTQTYKPQPLTYIGSARKARLEPHQVAMVAAHNSDLLAAKRAGLQTVFISRPTEHGLQQTTDLKADQNWDVVASDLVDVAAQLGC